MYRCIPEYAHQLPGDKSRSGFGYSDDASTQSLGDRGGEKRELPTCIYVDAEDLPDLFTGIHRSVGIGGSRDSAVALFPLFSSLQLKPCSVDVDWENKILL